MNSRPQRRKITQSLISGPAQGSFIHVAHIGYDAERGFVSTGVDTSWRALLGYLEVHGVDEQMIQENMNFVEDFVRDAQKAPPAQQPKAKKAPKPPAPRRAEPPAPPRPRNAPSARPESSAPPPLPAVAPPPSRVPPTFAPPPPPPSAPFATSHDVSFHSSRQ